MNALPATISAANSAVVERAPLTRAVDIAASIVPARNSIPILGSARLTGDGSRLFVTTTDLDIEITVAVPSAADSNFATTIPAIKLRDLLRKATASDFVAFTAPGAADDPAVIDFERVKYRLPALPVADYPETTHEPASHAFTMTGASLWRSLDSTMAAISTEETRYYLNGIFCHVAHNGALRFVATDGHRLYVQELAAPEGSGSMPGAIIPKKAVDLLYKLMKGKACPDSVLVERAGERLRFSWQDSGLTVTVHTKLIDATFPDYERVIPMHNDVSAAFDPEAMLESVTAVSLIVSERGRAVRLTMSPDKIRLSVTNHDGESAVSDVPATFTGHDGFEIGFNAGYILDILATASPDGSPIVAKLDDAGSPAVFTGSREGWTAVLMPMRL